MEMKDRIEVCKANDGNCDACSLETEEDCICLDCNNQPSGCADCKCGSNIVYV